jgi:hypothetical protein
MILAVGARKRHEIVEGVEEAHRRTNNRKTYPSCQSSIIPILCSPKTVSWLNMSPFYLVGKENGMQMVSACAETSKEKATTQQHLQFLIFIEECTTIILFSCAS